MPQLPLEEIERHLAQLPGWTYDGRALVREYRFPDFQSALTFVNSIADLAEITGQHPEIRIAGARVSLVCSDRIARQVSYRDIQFARQIQNFAESQETLPA